MTGPHESTAERHGEEAERFVPETMGGSLIEAEHRARYDLAAQLVAGRRVLDAGCGVGWGSGVLLEAGARSVTGIDLDPGAVADATERVPGARFVVGDLAATGLAAGSFDVVVCFEALEHVDGTEGALDELVRLLADDGVLLVSSPNPAVYPAGNPFHVHELTPDELMAAVDARLPHTRLLRQHGVVASVLVADPAAEDAVHADAGPVDLPVNLRAVAALRPGHDPYAVVAASRQPLPPLTGVAMAAPSEQLDHLDALARALTEERARLHEDHERIVAERVQLLQQLDDADQGMHRLMDDVRRAQADRDRFAVGLVTAEQELARRAMQLDAARDENEVLNGELEAIRATVSWKVTGPLRSVRRQIPARD